jgi:hypothetical protein
MMGTMNTSARTTLRSATESTADAPSPEQLTLLPATSTPARFRLSRDTRERGLRHVAEIRRMLAARSEHSLDTTAPSANRAA